MPAEYRNSYGLQSVDLVAIWGGHENAYANIQTVGQL